jgi:F420-dependent oxidoreductase-like protein
LKILTHPVRDRIPIYIAALGEQNVRLTAEIADGWLPILFIPERAGDVWGEALAAGRAKRSPELGPLEIVAGGPLAIGEGLEPYRDLARPNMALYVGGMGARGKNFYNDLAKRYGYAAEAELVQDLYLSGQKEEAAAAIPAEFVELTSLIGTEEFVRGRIEALAAAGVTVLNVNAVGPDPAKDLALVKQMLGRLGSG